MQHKVTVIGTTILFVLVCVGVYMTRIDEVVMTRMDEVVFLPYTTEPSLQGLTSGSVWLESDDIPPSSINYYDGERKIVYVPRPEPNEPDEVGFEDLLDAIEQVESGGDANAISDNGKAIGNFQLHEIYVDDVNRIAKLNHIDKYSVPMQYKYHHREDPVCSRFMVNRYLRYYYQQVKLCDALDEIIDGNLTPYEIVARIHNGGPDGWKKESTKPYWKKVKRALEGE